MDGVSIFNQTGVNTTPIQTPTTTNAGSVDYDAFLTLLVAQLRNQDPTEPTDNAELMAQLASFSAVEQQIQTNDKLNTLIQASQLSQASSIIGNTITSADGQVSGIVESVILTDEGLHAQLQSGERVLVGNGTAISN